MLTVFVHEAGQTRPAPAIDPAWLAPDSPVLIWVDLADPTPEEAKILSGVFRFHELAIEDALAELHIPKAEEYPGFLYLVLHGIDFQASQHRFATHEIDFFLGPRFLVTVHDGQSRSIDHLRHACSRANHILSDGTASLMHRIVDSLVDNYAPEVDKIEERLEQLEDVVFERPERDTVRRILEVKRDIIALRRVTTPQRDVVGRLARREFPNIPEAVTYRLRDVYDHLVRFNEESMTFHDRITALLDAHLSNVSNRLNEVMKVLTFITTIAVPFTVLGGLYGMNVKLPGVPGEGSPEMFWALLAIAAVAVVVMAWVMRRRHLL